MTIRALSILASSTLTFALVACSGSPSGTSEALEGQGAAESTDIVCSAIPSGPFTVETMGQPFNGSEDFTFDGQGHMIGKVGNQLMLVGTSLASPTNLASLPGQTYGVRYNPNGNLIAAIPGAGKVVSIAPGGAATDLLTGLRGPNGIYIDFDGTTWLTEFNGNRVSRIAPDGTQTTLVSGGAMAQGADGIAHDAARGQLYYTEYGKGKVNRIAVDGSGAGTATPVTVATIQGAALDGMVLDACGNVYVVDNGASKVYRVRIDANGAAAGAPELLGSFPKNVAAVNFGSGPGFDPKKIYLTGNPGVVYAISVGVTGAPVPTPPAH
jgi:sugar lactone lactonase YvrE